MTRTGTLDLTGVQKPGGSQPRTHSRQALTSRPTRKPPMNVPAVAAGSAPGSDRKSTRLNSSHGYISYAVFCLKKKKKKKQDTQMTSDVTKTAIRSSDRSS